MRRQGYAALALLFVALISLGGYLIVAMRDDDAEGPPAEAGNLCGAEATGPFTGGTIFENERRFQWGTYKTIEEARAETGLPILDVTAPGWSFAGASQSSGDIPAAIHVTYACRETNGTNISVTSFPAGFRNLTREPMPAEAGDRDVGLLRSPDGRLLVVWDEGDRTYTAVTVPGPGFGESEILQVIASLE
jgi:hypothetical protein